MALASGISNVPHLVAFDELAKERLEGLDLSVLLVYMVDSAPAESLFYLASQFDVLGWKGWSLANNDADRRALIKRAIELHRYKGTVWAIKQAVQSVGFTDCKVIEHVGLDYDGTANFDGSNNYAGGHWANFRVKIGLSDTIVVDVTLIELVHRLVLEYKNVRSFLVGISFTFDYLDDLPQNDLIDLTITINGNSDDYQF